jgi:uncharacterized protein involved in exopolysaccharide biosynthesis
MQGSISTFLLATFKIYLAFLRTKIGLIVGVTALGAALGFAYVSIKPIKYTARSSFVVEDSKSLGGSGLMGAISGQLGPELLGALGGSNLLSGENIIELAKSRSLLRKTFLTSYDGSEMSLADRYATSLKLKEDWLDSRKVGVKVDFSLTKKPYSRLEDSLLNTLIDRVIKKDIEVFKPDRRLSLFEINITMRDEQLASLFCKRLLTMTSDLYINAKTKRIKGNISRLQHLADSLQRYANQRVRRTAQSNFKMLDLNPQYYDQEAESTINSREESLSGMIYAEVLKNLEISKASLLQETPTIQLVDTPDTPLPSNLLEWYEGLIFGLLGGFFASVFLLIFLFDPKNGTE